jgi:uncharacterized membrane protein
MQTPEFRRILRQEASQWEQDGLIDRNLHAQLADRYQFDKLEDEASNSFVTILTGLGCVLIGMGILSFVAANWQYLDKTWRIAVMLILFVVVNSSGFYLWQQGHSKINQQRFGEGLLLLGGLLFGANIALLSQLFHIGGEIGVLFMGWSIGVMIMAYCLRMASLGIFTLILMGMGYWGLTFHSFSSNNVDLTSIPEWAQLLYQHMPIFAVVAFGLLAYRCKSLPIFGLAAIAWLTSLQFSAVRYVFLGSDSINLLALALACGLPPLCLWAAGRLQTQWSQPLKVFGWWSEQLAVVSAGLTCFFLSLDFFIRIILRLDATSRPLLFDWQLDRTIFLIVAVLIWGWLWSQKSRLDWTFEDTGLLLLGLLIPGLILIVGSFSGHQVSQIANGSFFVLLAAITLGCIRAGLLYADRAAFYFGWLLLTVRILTWFAFTQTDLLLKSVLFILGGIATITVGWWFEQKLRQSRQVIS